MRYLFLFVILISVSSIAKAQKEKMTVGFRGGYNWGPTITLSDGYRGVKGLLSFRDRGTQATAIYILSKPLENKYRFDLFFYYGVGAHLGYIKSKKKYYCDNCSGFLKTDGYHRRTYPVIGFDGLFGAEYRFYTVPLIIAVDFKPFFEFFGENFFRINLYDFGVTLKYRIN